MRFLDDVFVIEVGQDGHQKAPVPVICHSATVVTLPGQVSYGLEGHLIIFIHKQLKKYNKINVCTIPAMKVSEETLNEYL